MLSRLAIVIFLSLLAFTLIAVSVHAHGGGLDSHCVIMISRMAGITVISGPLADESLASKQEILTALDAPNQLPKDIPMAKKA